MNMFSRFMNDESGATAIEYGLIAAIVAVGIIAGLGTMKEQLVATFGKVETSLSTANGGGAAQ
jgi:pilus assembly protein Flp/PilA